MPQCGQAKPIVADGKLAGIVDVDDLFFGDPIYLLGLINMAVKALNFDTDYSDYWRDALLPTQVEEPTLGFYTAVFCVNFMSELGQRFNRDTANPIDPSYIARLQQILDSQLAQLS